MRNIMIIGMIVVAMGFMFNILYTKYENTMALDKTTKNLNEKK